MTWRRAQIVLLSAQRMTRAEDQRGRVHRSRHGPRRDPQLQPGRLRRALSALPGRPAARRSRCRSGSEIKRIALTRSRPISVSRLRPGAWPSWPTTWSPRGWSTDISHEGLRQLLREEGVRFQAVRTLEALQRPRVRGQEEPDPRALRIADGRRPGRGRVVICLDEFGPLNLQPQPGGKAWAPRAKPQTDPRHLHPPARRPPPALLPTTSALTCSTARSASARPASSSSPSAATSAPATRPRSGSHFVLDNFSPHKGDEVRDWAAGQQRRARLHAPLRLLAQPDRGAVQRRCATSASPAPTTPTTPPRPG